MYKKNNDAEEKGRQRRRRNIFKKKIIIYIGLYNIQLCTDESDLTQKNNN